MHLLRAPSFAMLLLLLIVPSGWSQYTDRREYCRLYSERLQDWCMNEGAPKQQEAPKLEEDPKTAALRMATNTLGPIYYRYIFLKKCHEIREGYATVFISEAELERARQATKRLEDNIKLPGLNLTWLWEEANRRVNAALLRSLPDRATCQVMLRELFQAHQRHHPDAGGVEKDF